MPLPDGWSARFVVEGSEYIMLFARVVTGKDLPPPVSKSEARTLATAMVAEVVKKNTSGSIPANVCKLDLTSLDDDEAQRVMGAYLAAAGTHNALGRNLVPGALGTQGTAVSLELPVKSPSVALPSEDSDGLTLPSHDLDLGVETSAPVGAAAHTGTGIDPHGLETDPRPAPAPRPESDVIDLGADTPPPPRHAGKRVDEFDIRDYPTLP